jgi:hypothetical protein
MAKFKRIDEVKNGKSEWIQPVRRGYKMMCCDCSLVHNVDFRIVRRNSTGACFIQLRAGRNARSTALARRKKKS